MEKWCKTNNKNHYDRIIQLAEVLHNIFNDQSENDLVSTYIEGGKKKVYTTVYERNRDLRNDAIYIHGYTCMACGFNFKDTYGEWGEGYIHVHHKNPVSRSHEKTTVNPSTDLDVLCANCHSMIHRRKDIILKMQELKKLLLENSKKNKFELITKPPTLSSGRSDWIVNGYKDTDYRFLFG